ncbi:radical SAM/SPASM domain-containing protein [Caulobacter vibrioides]|nr:radical SAM protein [Caulobacter vibrioides]
MLSPLISDADDNGYAALLVQYLYRDLLKREPDPDALAACVAWIERGATADEIRDEIIASPEYRERVAGHPIAKFPALYQPERISYFTHRGRFRPLALSIETVNICNNDCVICPYSIQTRKRQGMEMAVFAKVVADYVALGGGPVTLTPMVGEVLLDKQLLERLKLLRAMPSISRVSAITNATMAYLYTDEELAELATYFDRITVSVYGLDAEEFQLMTRKDQYDQFMESLGRLIRIFGVGKVALGARHLRKRPSEEVEAWLTEVSQRAGVEAGQLTLPGTKVYANWTVFDTSKPLPLDAEWMPAQQNTEQCALPLISLQVLSSGKVSFCGCADFDGKTELVLGDIREASLSELLGSERVRALWDWRGCGVPEPCKGCSFHMPISKLDDLHSAFSDPLGTFGG